MSAYMPLPGATTYTATKAGVAAFTYSLRNELKGSGVSTLLLLTPGVETRMFNDIPDKYSSVLDLKKDDFAAISTEAFSKMVREAIREDLEVLIPDGKQGIAYRMARYLPVVFDKLVISKMKRPH